MPDCPESPVPGPSTGLVGDGLPPPVQADVLSPRIGYLVPEFPGQTHIMFWRELAELRRQGAAVSVLSTRRPGRGARPHRWSDAAVAETIYLFPPRPGLMLAAV